jgi:hypothetical protein
MNKRLVTHSILQFKPTRSELSKISRIIRNRDAFWERYHAEKLSWEECSNLCAPIWADLNGLADEIGRRTLGELPLTLKTDWSEHCGASPVVVLNVSVISDFGRGYSWLGHGLALRKDGSVGLKESSIRLDNHLAWRRRLDGSWSPLQSEMTS